MIAVYVANKCPVIDFDPTYARIGYETKDWNKAPNGEKLGDFETRPMAFQAMNKFAESVRHLIPKESCGLINTFTKERPDGLYVAYFDRGVDKNGMVGTLKKSCIEFVLLYSQEGKITIDEVRRKFTEKARAGYTSEVRSLLTKYGVNGLSDIKEEDYEAILEEAMKIGGGDKQCR